MGLKHNDRIDLTIVDGLFILLSIVLIVSMNHAVVLLEPFLMVYCLLRMLFSISFKWTSSILAFIIAAFCLYELSQGYIQLFQKLGVSRGQVNGKIKVKFIASFSAHRFATESF